MPRRKQVKQDKIETLYDEPHYYGDEPVFVVRNGTEIRHSRYFHIYKSTIEQLINELKEVSEGLTDPWIESVPNRWEERDDLYIYGWKPATDTQLSKIERLRQKTSKLNAEKKQQELEFKRQQYETLKKELGE